MLLLLGGQIVFVVDMQSTGHSSTQERSTRSTHALPITYVMPQFTQ